MASLNTLKAETAEEFAAALSGAHSMEEWGRWKIIADSTPVGVLDERCFLRYKNSKVNLLPSSLAPKKIKPSLPGRTTEETAKKYSLMWDKIGERMAGRKQKK